MASLQSIDVIIVSYFSASRMEACLAAVSAFAGLGARITVVDNSAEPLLQDVLNTRAPEATLIVNPLNRGFGAAVNQALEATAGAVAMLVNPDISDIRGSLVDVLAYFTDYPRVAAIGARLVREDGQLQRSCKSKVTLARLVVESLGLTSAFVRHWPGRQMADWRQECTRRVDAVCGACVFLRREALEDVGLFDERFFMYYEETDWMLRAKARSWEVVLLPAVEAVHAAGASSDSVPRDSLSLLLLESQQRFIAKHWGRPVDVASRLILVAADSGRWVLAWVRPNRRARQKAAGRRLAVLLSGNATSAPDEARGE